MLKLVIRHPVTTLMTAYAVAMMLGLVLLAVMLAKFGVTDFAVIGVLIATGGLISMGLDFRLLDLVSLAFYDIPEDQTSTRLGVIRGGLSLIAIQVVLIGLLTFFALEFLSAYLLQASVKNWWFVSAGVFAGCQMGISGLTTFLRLNGSFTAAGLLRVAVQANNTILGVSLLLSFGSLDSYFLAITLAGIISLITALVTADRIVRKKLGGSLFALPSQSEFVSLIAQFRFLVSGAYFSLGWMMTRAADVLVLAFLSTDQVTGTYRVAKQCADAGQGLMDAIPQYFEPTIISALKRGAHAEFRKHRRRIIVIGTMATIGLVGGVLIVIAPIVETVYPRHLGSVVPLAILTATMATRSSIQPWLWPMLIANDQARLFSLLLVAGATCQLLLMALLNWWSLLDATSAALTSWIGVIVVFSPYLVIGPHKSS